MSGSCRLAGCAPTLAPPKIEAVPAPAASEVARASAESRRVHDRRTRAVILEGEL
jgi:hypothetical protein